MISALRIDLQTLHFRHYLLTSRRICINRRDPGVFLKWQASERRVRIEDYFLRLVLRQQCKHIEDPTSEEIQDFAMNMMFTCVDSETTEYSNT